ncbi:MAG: hypothetical protein K8J31_08225 [Anaerolineae bacterium]|nr:hypothetical protein [Anaerolineae bacterium]
MEDPRNIETGYEIPSENYCDQPYIVVTNDGAWLCVLTTGRGLEGDRGQHAVSSRSLDQGKTWSPLVDIESADDPESSWVMPLKVPNGRVYAIYNHNTDSLQEVVTDTGTTRRVDTLGYFQCKYSDDNGLSWSKERYLIPLRVTQIDRDNPYQGKIQYFWGVGKPMIHNGKAYFGFAKVGRFGHGFMATSEGYFLCSENVLTETDPAKVEWELLPEGEVGLKAVHDVVADEHNLVGLSDRSLFCTYRTIEGHPCHAYSRDGGRSWTEPAYMTYTPGGRMVKHPRAANFVRKFSNGKFIYWFHNNGMKWYNQGPARGSRNVAWLMGGIEKDGYIHWSQPEILLYEPNEFLGPSYPDFVEENGRYFVSATQKTVARIHEIDSALLEGLWNQADLNSLVQDGLVLNLSGDALKAGAVVDLPDVPSLSNDSRENPGKGAGASFSLDFRVRFDNLDAGQVLLDGRDEAGRGIWLTTTDRGTVQINLRDQRMGVTWDTDPGVLQAGKDHHIAVIVDSGPRIISFVVDGVLCDGGEARMYGWGRFNRFLQDVNGAGKLTIAPSLNGELRTLRMYNRYLRTSEAISNYQSGR